MGKYSNLVKNVANDDGKVKFLFINGKYSGGEFSIRDGQKLSIGRDISSDVAIVDSKVSRNHASITAHDGKLFIEDHNSTNGTYVNGEKLSPSIETELKMGSKFSIGDSTILVGDEKEADENAIELSFTNARKIQETTIPVAQATVAGDDEEESFTLDESLQVEDQPDSSFSLGDEAHIIAPDPSSSFYFEQPKVKVGQLSLNKTSKLDIAKDNLANSKTSSTGSLSAMDITDLLKVIARSASSSGYLKLNITSPFEEQIEVTIGSAGIVACESVTNKNFSQEKALSRALLARDGEYVFKVDAAPKNETPNRQLEDLFMDIANQSNALMKYRKIVNYGKLEFAVPLKGKLSNLSKVELDSLQFMINSIEVIPYLNSFADNDDMILLAEITKYIDLGIISDGQKFDMLSDDVIDF
ncbi:FHA domain-containing protein [bacterium]|nr:FHA domain-containing protein [bacterium]